MLLKHRSATAAMFFFFFLKAGSETFRCFMNTKLNQAGNTNVRPMGIEASESAIGEFAIPILNF